MILQGRGVTWSPAGSDRSRARYSWGEGGPDWEIWDLVRLADITQDTAGSVEGILGKVVVKFDECRNVDQYLAGNVAGTHTVIKVDVEVGVVCLSL